jgi:hypothetical protein
MYSYEFLKPRLNKFDARSLTCSRTEAGTGS